MASLSKHAFGFDHIQTAPISAARRAAEAAFAAPRPALASHVQAQVTVRRTRAVRPDGPQGAEAVQQAAEPVALQAARPGMAHAVTAIAEPATKRARVFRIETTTNSAAPAESLKPGHDHALADAAAPVWAHTAHPRKRRVPTAHRSGPVVVVQHPPAPASPDAAPDAPRAADLADRLARLAPVWAAIKTAQCYQFIDNGMQAQWQRLSSRADELLLELLRQRR